MEQLGRGRAFTEIKYLSVYTFSDKSIEPTGHLRLIKLIASNFKLTTNNYFALLILELKGLSMINCDIIRSVFLNELYKS